MLKKKFRLSSKEFPKVYTKGLKSKGVYGVLISLPSENEIPQFGFVVSKKVGNAVIRHKVTRRLRDLSKEMIEKYEIKNKVFQYVAFTYTEDFQALKNEFEKQIKKLI
ncbi:ribonuclease P protein component [Candidatus Dojkabacteria bacterium]|jgi:ribonuclease P protein component|nr:ribonuclease P protein component [Candidatus Dojkabacteria bacterium]